VSELASEPPGTAAPASVDVRTPDGRKAGTVELPAEIFDVQANIPLMHQVVVAQQAAARQGTHSTLTRGEVRGGGTKPYRQKGTGRARQGSIRAPQFTGGGVVHGPTPRDYSQRTPKKMKAAALRGALSDRVRGGRLHVVSHFIDGDAPSTKAARAALAALTEGRRVLVVATREDTPTWLSLRNLPGVHVISPGQLNTYDVLVSDDVVFTRDAYRAFVSGRGLTPVVHETEVEEVAEPEPVKAATKAEAPKKAAPETEAPPETEVATATEVAEPADAAEGPHGPGSHPATEDGEAPEGFPVKGNAGSNLYHLPGSRYYDQTVAEVWFATAEDAEQAGFTKAGARKKAEPAEAGEPATTEEPAAVEEEDQ
jgi:large subunit ribosomal protein L4